MNTITLQQETVQDKKTISTSKKMYVSARYVIALLALFVLIYFNQYLLAFGVAIAVVIYPFVVQFNREINSLDLHNDKYSITLDEIKEELDI